MHGMDSGLYAAYTGLLSRTQALDTAANNLANAGTVGFRAQRDYFRSVLAGAENEESPSQVGDAVNDFGVLGGNLIDQGHGTVTATGNPLDMALNGPGFFAIKSAQGVQYTRDGAFLRSDTGVLQTAAGEPVLSTTGQPIPVPPGEVTIGASGVLSVAGGVVATVGVFTFPPGVQLTPEGANRYLPPQGTVPIPATNAAVHQGAIEAANQDVIQGSLDLIVMQRQAEMMQKALTIFHTEFNKTAVEDLPRV